MSINFWRWHTNIHNFFLIHTSTHTCACTHAYTNKISFSLPYIFPIIILLFSVFFWDIFNMKWWRAILWFNLNCGLFNESIFILIITKQMHLKLNLCSGGREVLKSTHKSQSKSQNYSQNYNEHYITLFTQQ